LERVAFPDRPYSRADFIYLLSHAREGFIIANAEDSLVGYVIATRDEEDGAIQSIAVVSGFRRKGIGEALMISALNHIAKCERVFLLVEANNIAAISLYHKLAFKETGAIKKQYYPNGADAIEMVRIASELRK
jgi:ribosomal-protein-alanine N-acetyltransferase